jgi:hypothetical protein
MFDDAALRDILLRIEEKVDQLVVALDKQSQGPGWQKLRDAAEKGDKNVPRACSQGCGPMVRWGPKEWRCMSCSEMVRT